LIFYLFIYVDHYTLEKRNDDDDKDDFYGCSCQRYLAVGLLMPILLLISLIGCVLLAVIKIGENFINTI